MKDALPFYVGIKWLFLGFIHNNLNKMNSSHMLGVDFIVNTIYCISTGKTLQDPLIFGLETSFFLPPNRDKDLFLRMK